MTSIAIGKELPNFKAPSSQGEFSLSTYKGKFLVLYFYPKDNTPGCTQQGMDFRDLYDEFQKENVAIVGVSRDSLASHEKFIQKFDFPFPLISDTDETVCRLFGVLKQKKMYGKIKEGIVRSTFLIDPSGILLKEWRALKVDGHVKEVLQSIKELKS